MIVSITILVLIDKWRTLKWEKLIVAMIIWCIYIYLSIAFILIIIIFFNFIYIIIFLLYKMFNIAVLTNYIYSCNCNGYGCLLLLGLIDIRYN